MVFDFTLLSHWSRLRTEKRLMILIAGPCRSGTANDIHLISENVRLMTETAAELYRMGHLPVLAEWFATPLSKTMGSKFVADPKLHEIFRPLSARLIDRCDGVLRIGGVSSIADKLVRTGERKGKAIYYSVEDVPLFEFNPSEDVERELFLSVN